MGFLDKLKLKATEVKDKAVGAVDDHGPQIKGGIEKAGDFVDKKTKGKYSDKIAKGTKKAGEAVDKIDKPETEPPTGGTPPLGDPSPPPRHAPPTGHTPPSGQTPPPPADGTP